MKPIEAKNVDVYYGENHVLKDISLSIKENTVTAFIGPSGCGKTTLLNIISGLIAPSEGRVLFDERLELGEHHTVEGRLYSLVQPPRRECPERVHWHG